MSFSSGSSHDNLSASELVQRLRSRTLRNRTGILLLPPTALQQIEDIAARLGIQSVDYRRLVLQRVPPGSRYAGISVDAERQTIDALLEDTLGKDCVLLYYLDLILARLEYAERQRLWTILFRETSNRSRALVLAMPATAKHLLPSADALCDWKKDARVALYASERP